MSDRYVYERYAGQSWCRDTVQGHDYGFGDVIEIMNELYTDYTRIEKLIKDEHKPLCNWVKDVSELLFGYREEAEGNITKQIILMIDENDNLKRILKMVCDCHKGDLDEHIQKRIEEALEK